ncbi:uncharacterized protein DS421_17g601730 [Arachis hypogaea]|nr:uncharacterized protein DS421_17g601730 [Arachis hypogaea]
MLTIYKRTECQEFRLCFFLQLLPLRHGRLQFLWTAALPPIRVYFLHSFHMLQPHCLTSIFICYPS